MLCAGAGCCFLRCNVQSSLSRVRARFPTVGGANQNTGILPRSYLLKIAVHPAGMIGISVTTVPHFVGCMA
jgi:hypothetical protein